MVVHYYMITNKQVVKVYVSVFGDERGKDVAIAGLKSKAKYVRSVLGKRMKLRLTPEIRFIEDESFERGSRVSNKLTFYALAYIIFLALAGGQFRLLLRMPSTRCFHLIFITVSECMWLCLPNFSFIFYFLLKYSWELGSSRNNQFFGCYFLQQILGNDKFTSDKKRYGFVRAMGHRSNRDSRCWSSKVLGLSF